jgi:DNA-binding transcriptional MerR regulator
MSVAAEATALHNTWDRVEEIERVAATMPEQDSGRATLHEVVRKELAAASPVRPRTAAEILGLTEKTVRAWATEGILTTTRTAPTVLLDPQRLHEIYHLIEDLREAGKTRGLLDEVHRRLVDQRLLEREDLAEGLAQLRRGEGILVRNAPSKT